VTTARTLSLTALAMVAFASNSILCRLALRQTSIDPATFTLVRILSGAIALWLVMQMRREKSGKAGNWLPAFAVSAYAAAFSFAYLQLSAGTGALLLFGAVQATMISWGLLKGEHLDAIQVVGLIVAITGLTVLLVPGLSAPPLFDSVIMLIAGIAWGIYSLCGRGEKHPVGATAGNFLRAIPFAVVLIVVGWPWIKLDASGVFYATISGAITSGLGYVIWYRALPGLRAASAATVQLSVPVLAATGGIILLGERISLRYVLASLAVLGGIALVVIEKAKKSKKDEGRMERMG
jgi:drug/metabolite transporter (DMT)-like permease